MDEQLIPEAIRAVLSEAQAERERLAAERLAEMERERLAAEQELAEQFQAFYTAIEPLIPEYLRPYACIPQRFGEEKIPQSYHFDQNRIQNYLAFDIPGLAAFVARRDGGDLEYIIPDVYGSDYDDPPVHYKWGDWVRKTINPGEALLLAQKAHDEYWERTETFRRRAEAVRRAQDDAAEARKRLAEMIASDPVLRLLALVVAQVQAEREGFEQELDAAHTDAESARSRAEKARREASAARYEAEERAREAESLRWDLERLEKSLTQERRWRGW